MARVYLQDLRERVVAAVMEGGLSRRQAPPASASRSAAIRWVDRYQENGSAAPGKMGGYKSKKNRR